MIIDKITELQELLITEDIPEGQKSRINGYLETSISLIQNHRKGQAHNEMIELLFNHIRQVEDYKGCVPTDLETEEIEHNIKSLETITELFNNLY